MKKKQELVTVLSAAAAAAGLDEVQQHFVDIADCLGDVEMLMQPLPQPLQLSFLETELP